MNTQFAFLEKKSLFWFAAAFSAVIIVIAVVCSPLKNLASIYTTQNVPGSTPKWHTLPPGPIGLDYDCRKRIRAVMNDMAEKGPFDYFGDHIIDCKDYTCSFIFWWYIEYDAPDGTCIIVRNVNKDQRFDHCFVAVWVDDRWVFIEPQACKNSKWTLKSFWGSKYDPEYNCYNETRKFISFAFNKYYAPILIKKTLVDETYTIQYWDDTHPIQYHRDIW